MVSAKQKILIYRLGSLGDTVMVLPSFHKIRKTYPEADITLLTNVPINGKAAPLQSILGNSGYFFNRVLSYPIGTRDPALLIQLLKQIRALKIDTVIYLAGVRVSLTLFKTKLTALRDRLFFKAAGAKTLIGFPAVLEDFQLSIDAETGVYEWEAKRLARRLQVLGDIPLNEDAFWDLRLTKEELKAAGNELSALNDPGPFIAASTGTKLQANDWEEHNWETLLKQLSEQLPQWPLIMLGGPDEKERADRCLAAWGGKGLNLCGKTSPRVSGAVLQRANVFIGHDSGPMHLAAAVGTPCVAVFSARNFPQQWYPRGNFNHIIYHQTDCAGCRLDICIEQKKKCILSITASEVQSAVMSVLARNNYNI
ncbi:glycosyltransferase family 9 protein [Mucilaginibacter segetis]|uniref:Glycosyltransferase family 9 protein n=1 Tax=Mucilaginibacter segetis TaxID=2793071 RepID=A0A934UNQ7_9SPHI|nr:glycosyltransferase family 9 protein [Mucilaginibacter segetis]MBK0380664.1 glycosyltransferase family 9 protein [Mucilaginibacter segetis]